MTARKPLVMSGGQIRQLAAGDTLDVAASLAHGTSWPAAPSLNEWFAHDTLGVIAQWTGTQWLGATQYQPIAFAKNLSDTTWPNSLIGAAGYVGSRKILKLHISGLFQGNNATNYFTMRLVEVTGLLLHTHNTSLMQNDTWLNYERDVSTSSNIGIELGISKNGSPTLTYVYASISYRHIF